MPTSTDWHTAAIDRLKRLWAEGFSTAEIGRRLGMTKNAVIGKAHRLKLPPRSSPIRGQTADTQRAPKPKRVSEPTLASLRVHVPSAPPPALAAAPLPAPCPAMPRSPASPYPGRDRLPCSWPLGQPGRAEFRYCDAAVVPGKPYCGEHCQRAYARWRPTGAPVAGAAV